MSGNCLTKTWNSFDSLNLNTGGRNFDESKPVVARNAVHHSTQCPSQVTITVVRR